MTWKCDTCSFTDNADQCVSCIACGTSRPNPPPIPISSSSVDAFDEPPKDLPPVPRPGSRRVEQFILEEGQKLGVKLRPPKKGIVGHGISVENIQNPALEGRIHNGDIIVAIGGKVLQGMGFSDAINMIRQLPRPLEITFEIVESRRNAAKKKANEDIWNLDAQLTSYAIVFDNGPMGLNLEEAVRYGIDGAVVKAFKGQADESGMISIGDIVSKVNDTDVLFMPYADVMNTIRKTSAPRTIQFVPKDKLADIQRINSRQSEVIRPRETMLASKFAASTRIVKDDGEMADKTSITDLIIQNSAATIKKGRLFKQGRLVRNWKSRYFVLSVSKLEYFKSPTSTTSQGDLVFISNRSTVRDIPPQDELVSKSPAVSAKHLIELRVGDRKLVVACVSDADKKAWIDALKLAIDASKTVNRTNSLSQSLAEAKSLRDGRSQSMHGDDISHESSSRLSEYESDSFSTPIVHVTVLSASNLAKKGNSVNACCEITLDSETFKTSVVKNHRNPVWKQDHSAAFEVLTEDAILEIRIFDERTFRSNDLISTLTVPIRSLPNMKKAIKKYPLVLSNRSTGAKLTLALEYTNKAKAFQQEEERLRLGDDLARASVMMERDEMLKIQSEAQAAADEAAQTAMRAEEEANALLEEAQRKAQAAVAAAREEAEQGKAAVEAAMVEAAEAKEEAERQAAEAKRAQEEAHALIEANQQVQETTNAELDRQQMAHNFISYRRMLMENIPQEKVREKMVEDHVDEINIAAFFEGMTSYDQKIKELQAKVESLTRREKTEKKPDADFHALAKSEISKDQEKLLRRLLKLEKQLQQAGISIAEDIPYEEAKAQIGKISGRMQEIGSADVIHEDLAIQKQLREEYFKLEQDMEKYNTALMLSDEYAADQSRKEQEWEDANKLDNIEALYAIRRSMPVDIKSLSEAVLQSMKTPNGGSIPKDMARKFKRTNVLEILRTNPVEIQRMHPSLLENLRVTGLTLTERRALHVHFKDIAETWKVQQKEDLAGRKWAFFEMLRQTFKPLLNSYNTHIEQYGPPGNHPYATRDDPDNGCPLIGRQCPLKANANPSYGIDLGFPAGDVYAASTVHKGDAENAGAKALREAQELLRAKAANARSDALKKHYRGNVREAAKANGACEDIDSAIDKIETVQRGWIESRLKNKASLRTELTEFNDLISSVRLRFIGFTERSGMNLSGKRNTAKDSPDTRSNVEIGLLEILIEAVYDCLRGIEKRMDDMGTKEKRIRSSIESLRQFLLDLQKRNKETMRHLKKIPTTKNFKCFADLMTEVTTSLAEGKMEHVVSDESRESRSSSSRGGRGGRGGRGRGSLFAQLKKKESGSGDGGLMSAIQGRRGGGRGGAGRGDFLAALASRKKQKD